MLINNKKIPTWGIVIFIGIIVYIAYYLYQEQQYRNHQLELLDREKTNEQQLKLEEFISKRQKECYDIYDREFKKRRAGTVAGSTYDKIKNVCIVQYRDTKTQKPFTKEF